MALAVRYSAIGGALDDAGVERSDAGRELFAVRPIDRRRIARYYDASHVY